MKKKYGIMAIMLIATINYAGIKDFYSDPNTKIDNISTAGATPSISKCNKKIYRFGFYEDASNATQPLNFLITYNSCSPMTSGDRGIVFASNFSAQRDPWNLSYGKLAKNSSDYYSSDGRGAPPYAVYYQITKGPKNGQIYRIGDIEQIQAHLAYIVPQIDVVYIMATANYTDPPDVSSHMETTINLIDLRYIDDPSNSNFNVQIRIDDASGLGLGRLKWLYGDYYLWGTNSLDALASSTTCRIGMQKCGYPQFAGYVDLSYNKTNHGLSTAAYHVLIQEKYQKIGSAYVCTDYGTLDNSGNNNTGGTPIFEQIKVNPAYTNLITFVDAFMDPGNKKNALGCALQYHLIDVNNAKTPSTLTFYETQFPNASTGIGNATQGWFTHETWSEDGEWLYTNPDERKNGYGKPGIIRINKSGSGAPQVIFDTQTDTDPLNNTTPVPPAGAGISRTDVAWGHQANWGNKFAVMDRQIWGADLPTTPPTPATQMYRETFIDFRNINNPTPKTLCEVYVDRTLTAPMPLHPHAHTSFSHSGNFITFQYQAIPLSSHTHSDCVWAVGVIPRENAVLPIPDMNPIINFWYKR